MNYCLISEFNQQGEGGDEDEATMMEVEGAAEMVDGSVMDGDGNTLTSIDGNYTRKLTLIKVIIIYSIMQL